MTQQEKDADFTELIHHSDKRKPHGCLPLNMLLLMIPVLAVMLVINIEMPAAPQESGEGNIYLKSSAYAYSNTRTISPLPFKLPSFADPAQTDSFVPELVISRDAIVHPAPLVSPFKEKRGSALLDKEWLLALPEVSSDKTAAPTQEGDAEHGTP